VTGDGLLLFPSEGDGGSHSGNESLLLLVHGSSGGLSHGHGVILFPLSGGYSDDDGGLLLVNGEVGGAVWHGRQDSSG
jgi:hypothetical protein